MNTMAGNISEANKSKYLYIYLYIHIFEFILLYFLNSRLKSL